MKLRNWREIRDRLAGMERAELRDRIRQELAKREDGFLSRLGYRFARDSRNPDPIKAGNFFFRADSIEDRKSVV